MQYPWAPHHMTPERRNIAADLAFVRYQNPPYIALMQYRVTSYGENLKCFLPSGPRAHVRRTQTRSPEK